MDNDIEKWIRRNRLLRPRKSNKEQYFKYLYSLVLNNRTIPAQPYVYDSHHADISQVPHLNAIICDIHFWDIAWLVASSFYVNPTHDIMRLADLLIADSLLCHGNPLLSLEYAHRYIDDPYTTVFSATVHDNIYKTIGASVQFQIEFAMAHEISHYLCDTQESGLAIIFKSILNNAIDNQNRISKVINSIDLSPIQQHLDAIDMESAFSYPSPDISFEIINHAMKGIYRIVREYGYQVNMPDNLDENERKLLLVYACDNYIRKLKANLLPKEIILTEGLCDLLALTDLLPSRVEGKTEFECYKLCLEGYVLALLALDMIQGAMNIHQYSDITSYKFVDTIYMRRELEKQVLPIVFEVYNIPDRERLLACYQSACDVADIMYAKFCEYTFSKEYICAELIPQGSKEWVRLYCEINRLLQLPV